MNRSFNLRLYAEGLRRVRALGIVFGVLTLLISLIPSIMNAVTATYKDGASFLPNVVDIAPVLIPFAFIIAVVMIYRAFSFLNARNTSDYYHSIAHTRAGIYFSFAAAAMTWVYGIIIVNIAGTVLVYAICGTPLNAQMILPLILNYIAMATFGAGCAAIATCLTGVWIGNIILTLIIAFLPRFLIYALQVITEMVANLGVATLGFIFQDKTNLVTGSVINAFFGGSDYNILLLNPGAIAYTLILGLIYIGLGYLCFSKRKSELAGRNTQSRVLQGVYRCLLAVPFLIIASILAVFSNSEETVFGVIIVVILALFIYLLFELLTTKKAKNLLKALPFFLIPIAFSILFVFGANGLAKMITLTDEDVANVESISLLDSGIYDSKSSGYLIGDNISPTYERLKGKEIVIDDEALVRDISEYVNLTNDRSNAVFGSVIGSHKVSFNLKNGGKKLCIIGLNNELIDRVAKNIAKRKDVMQTVLAKPTDDEIKLIEPLNGLDRTATYKIWQALKEDYAAIGAEKWGQSMNGNAGNISNPYDFEAVFSNLPVESKDTQNEGYGAGNIENIYVKGSIGMRNFYCSYPITDKTPKSAALYMKLLNEANGEKVLNMLKIVEDGKENDAQIINMSLTMQNAQGLLTDENGEYSNQFYMSDGKEKLEIAKIIIANGITEPDINKPFLSLYIDKFGSVNSEHANVKISLTDDKLNALIEIFKHQGAEENAQEKAISVPAPDVVME